VPPIFHPAQPYRGYFNASSQQLGFGKLRRGLFAQSVDFEFSQNVSMVYEVGTNSVWRVVGHAQGQAKIWQMFGPSAVLREFNCHLGKVESPKSLILEGNGSSESKATDRSVHQPHNALQSISIKHAVITQVGASAGTKLIGAQESTGLAFGDLDLKR